MITSDFGRRVFALEIGGLQTRYLSDDVDVSSSNLDSNLTTGVAYNNVQGIVEVGAYQASIDPAGGVAQYAPISVTLKVDRIKGTSTDPHVIFGRTGPRSTDVQKAQIEDVPHNFPSTVATVDQDFTSLSFPRVMHIGAETVRVSAATSNTITITDRGVGRTPIQNHISSLGGTNVPEVFTEIVNFRGRKASLWMCQKRPDGSLSNFTEIINGFIEESPNLQDGSEVSLSLVPLTALVDNTVSDTTLKTGLVANYHYFENVGNRLEYAITSTSRSTYDVEGNPTSGTLTLLLGTNEVFDVPNAYDETLQNGLDSSGNVVDVAHPRYPKMRNFAINYRLFPNGFTSNEILYNSSFSSANDFWTGYGFTADTSRKAMIDNPRTEIKSFEITSGVQRFPEIINDVLESNKATSPLGVDGSFLNWKINQDNQSINIETLVERSTVDPKLTFYSSRFALEYELAQYGSPRTSIGIWNSDINGIYPTSNVERLYYPIDFAETEESFQADPVNVNGSLEIKRPQTARTFDPPSNTGESINVPIRAVAKAYYQNGESVILVQDDLGLPTSATAGVSYSIQVVYYDRALDSESSQFFEVTHQSTASYSGTDVGFLLHLERPHSSSLRSSFGDWEGYEPTKIYLATRVRNLTPGQALLRLLQSGGGGKINGDYDLGGLGLNLSEDEIDIDSFLQYESIPNLTINLDLRNEGANFRDLITPLLQTLGAVLVMRRTEDGNCKIALQPIGLEQSTNAAITINEGDWLSDDPPVWNTYEDIVTQVEINFDYDPEEDKLRTKRVFNNQEAINRYSGERSKITLDLYGVRSNEIGSTAGDSFSYFLPVITRIFNLLSNPLRLWQGSIGTGQSMLVDAGRYAIVNSPLLKGYSPDYGVVNGVGFIKSIRQNLMSEGCSLEIIHIGNRSASWNDSGIVTGFTSTTVTIDQSSFSSTNGIGESVKDSDFFKVGDIVDYVLSGDHDNAITGLTISAITDNGTTATIEFTAAHGITGKGGTLEPTIYSNATADQQVDAYIADTNGKLGTANDDGDEYS
jgi:hypothetical protein